MPERPPKVDEGKPVSGAPFYPARAPRSGHVGAFNKFPPYIEVGVRTRDKSHAISRCLLAPTPPAVRRADAFSTLLYSLISRAASLSPLHSPLVARQDPAVFPPLGLPPTRPTPRTDAF